MSVIFWIWGIVAFLFGCVVLAEAKSAVHEIEAGIAFLVATVAIVGGTAVEYLHSMREELRKITSKAVSGGS